MLLLTDSLTFISNDESLSLFRRTDYARRFATTGKVEVAQCVKRGSVLLYIHDIVHFNETHKIPNSMVLNLDQTPVKYVPCGIATLAKQNTSSVPVSGV